MLVGLCLCCGTNASLCAAAALLLSCQGGGCDPYFTVSVASEGRALTKIFDFFKLKKTLKAYRSSDLIATLDTSDMELFVRDNVKFTFYDYDKATADDKVGSPLLHTTR